MCVFAATRRELAMGGFEVGWLPGFRAWTEAIHSVVAAGFAVVAMMCATTLALQVYRYVLTGLSVALGKRG